MSKDNLQEIKNIKDGAQLIIALKSEPGKLIIENIIARLTENMEKILTATMEDENVILARVYECRGIIRSLGDIGDKVTYAHAVVARRVVNQQIGSE